MDSFVEKFNIFDLFSMLIPGIITSTLIGISLSFKYYELWINLNTEKYIVFFIFSYFCGIVLQEFGTIMDNRFLYNILYGGKPREIFLLNNKYRKFFNDELSYKDSLRVKDYFLKYLNINDKECKTIEQQKELNSLIFAYCLNMSEINNLTTKSDKMIVISEMSRSLFWGCILTVILNLFMIFKYSCFYIFYYIEIIILLIISLIFLYRKTRYEKYRLRILLRTFLIYVRTIQYND